MKFRISKKTEEVEIKVSGVEGQEQQLLDAFQECKEGRCTCPTQEYQKLDALQVEHVNGEISLRLKPKEGAEFDQAEIERCLAHTAERIK
jgi:hypothetical protein